ncbi:MAG: LamG domain-containing protein, partial [Patescibacteria group bacterium]|nr:LamG domain-containing protein [Patescibacteria group bacterium]
SGNPDPTTYAIGSNLSITPFIHGLVGYWPLNEGSGTTAYDNSGWNNNGTLEGATDLPTWTTTGCLSHGSCLNFDGSDDYVGIPRSTSLDNIPNSIATVSCWIKTTSTNGMFLSSWSNGLLNGYQLDVGSGYDQTWSNQVVLTGGVTINNSSWHSITSVWNGVSDYIYVDGKLDVSANRTFSSSSGENQIGAQYTGSSYSDFINGAISNCAVYTVSLTASQIQAIYNAEKPQ